MPKGLAPTLSLKYVGYVEADTAHLNSVSKLFLKGSASSQSSPLSQGV